MQPWWAVETSFRKWMNCCHWFSFVSWLKQGNAYVWITIALNESLSLTVYYCWLFTDVFSRSDYWIELKTALFILHLNYSDSITFNAPHKFTLNAKPIKQAALINKPNHRAERRRLMIYLFTKRQKCCTQTLGTDSNESFCYSNELAEWTDSLKWIRECVWS